MRNISSAFKTALENDQRTYLEYADFVLENGTELHLTNEHFWQNGFSIEDAVSTGSTFQVGSAIINKATLVLNNIYEDFDEYDFFGATVTLSVGLELQNHTEIITLGQYTVVNQPTYNGSLISIEMYDNMYKFDKPYSDSTLTYPASLDTIIRDACTLCGVTLITTDFPNKNFVVQSRPDDEKLTFREMIAYIAQISGCYARCNQNGYLALGWFDQVALTEARAEDNVNGVHYIDSLYNKKFSTDDVVITGVRVSIEVERVSVPAGSEHEQTTYETASYLYGNEGYVIAIEGNPLISEDQIQTVAAYLGTRIVGFAFRTADISHGSDPSVEAGDVALCIDNKQRRYPILVSSTKFAVGSASSTSSIAEDPVRNSSARYTEATKNYVKLRELLAKEKTERERIIDDIDSRIENANGLYETAVPDGHGGVITYLHNKPDLEDSDIQIMVSDVGVTVTANGTAQSPTWYGLTVDGQLISNILTTVGINADWINTGQLVVSRDGVETMFVDVDTGTVRIQGDSISITTGGSFDTAIRSRAKESTREIMDNANAYGLGLKVNYISFSSANNGECYYHGYNTSGAPADVDGWVLWNGSKVTIPKGVHINPNTVLPYNTTIYNVFRTSNSTFTDIYWDSTEEKWYSHTYSDTTPGAKTAWTWVEATDIVLASYTSPSSEGAIQNAVVYATPRKYSDLVEHAEELAIADLVAYSNVVDQQIQDLQDQIDGAVETWFFDYTPTLSNEPAVNWTTETLKQEHEGDLFFDKSTGNSYRFFHQATGWEWTPIHDTAAQQALEAASRAQDTADGKRRVFVAQPTPPYDIGDLWMQGSSGDILTCILNKTSSGTYSASDWGKLNKYTDDTATTALAIRVGTLETETVAYYLYVSQAAVVKGTNGVYNPSTITVSAKSQAISEELSDYQGFFQIETKTGSTWTSRYTSGAKESSYTYTIPSNITTIRCSLYKEQARTTLLDQQTVPIVSDGTNGASITVTATEYKEGTSPTTAPTGTWSTTVPSVAEGNYLWTRVTYSDSSITYSVAKQGVSGNDGTSITVSSTAYAYQLSSSGTTVPTGTWSSTPQAPTTTQYAWTRTTTTFSDGSTAVTYTVGGKTGTNGTNGLNSAMVSLYQRGTSAPTKPTSALTYTFATGTLSGSLGNWSQTIPSGTNPVWAIYASASSSSATDSIAASEWSTQTKILENGADGQDGATGASGADGLNQATIFLYQRKSSTPSKPSSTVTYTFATGALSSVPSGWSRSIPTSDGNPCYVTTAVAVSASATYSIAASAWSDVTKMVEDGVNGTNGTNGLNNATVTLYQRGTSAPSKPTSALTYTFSTGVLSGSLGSWSQTIPSGTNPVWAIVATASSTSTTDSIASSEWSSQVKILENGEDGTNGTNGTDGYNQATIYLYQRNTSQPSKPSSTVTYTFSSGALSSVPSGWSRTIPTNNGNPCYVTTAAAIGRDATYSITSSAWSDVVKLVEDGVDGTNGTNGLNNATVTLYKRGTSAPAKPTSTLTYTFATGVVSGTLSSWSQTIPSGSDPVWAIVATASSTGATDTIASSEWSSQVKILENGADGQDGQPGTNGTNGTNGYNQATIYLYQRKSGTAPSKPSSSTTYTFSTGALSSVPTGWSRNVPTIDGNPCYVTTAAAISTSATYSIPTSAWSDVVKLVEDGADGQDGNDGADAYTIILTNESHSFAGSETAALAGSTTCNVMAYKGTAQITCYAGSSTSATSISTGVTGLTCAISNNNSTNVTLTFTATTSLTTRSGTVTIPIHADGKTFNKLFSFSIAPKGDRGATWYAGTAITGVSTTPTIFSGSGIASAIVGDHYLNTSTQNVYVCTTGGAASVAKWAYEQNIKGQEGTPGVSGTSAYFHVKYSDDGGQTFTGNTGEDPGEWIGTYTDDNPTDSTNVSAYTWAKIKGTDGEDAYYLETPFTWTSNNTVASFEAIVYKGETDITSDYPDAWFEWYLRNETVENRIAIGKTCNVSKSSLGYGSTITCVFTTYDNRSAGLLTRSGAQLETRSGLRLTTYIQAEGDQPITQLPVKTASEVLSDDYLLGIDAADGYRVSVSDFGTRLQGLMYDGRYVLKSGDTMTGNLTVNKSNASLVLRGAISTRIGAETLTSNTNLHSIYGYDSNGDSVFYSQLIRNTNNETYVSFVHRRYSANGGTQYLNGFYLYIDNSGNPRVAFPTDDSKNAWVTALNAVTRDGGSLTGNLEVVATGASVRRLTATNSAASVSTYVAASGNHGVYSQTLAKWLLYANTDGNVYVNGLNLSSADAARTALGVNGTVTVKSASSVSVASSTYVAITNSGSLSAGTYVVRYFIEYPTNATGRRITIVGTSSASSSAFNYMVDSRNAVSGGATRANGFGVFTITSATTLYLNAWQNSGSALSCNGRMEILKIH